MKPIRIKSIKTIPFEGTHDLPNTRQTLAAFDDVETNNLDALTKGILPPGKVWDWHEHLGHDELCIVVSGEGNFIWEKDIHRYGKDDVIIIPSGNKHKIEASGRENSEFYFVRIKV